jgi:predicted helicase
METIFRTYSLGVATNRDSHVYAFQQVDLSDRVKIFVEIHNAAVDRAKRLGKNEELDSLVDVTDRRIKWTRQTKASMAKGLYSTFSESHIREGMYRPFTRKWLYFDEFWNEERYQQPRFFPTPASQAENMAVVISDHGHRAAFSVLNTNAISDLHLCAASDGFQCFPFYTYNEDGSGRRENITEWALATFRERYGAATTKRDIFHYLYALLHHPEYRSRYAENLKRDLPRVPLVPDGEAFRAFVAAGSALADLHLGYETAEPYHLEQIIAEGATAKSMFHVEKMKLTKDKAAVIVNPHLTLTGIPPEAFAYRLGNRSALDWVLDQYQVSTDARSGITSDPNRPDDPEYIVRLIGQVVAVSVATVEIVGGLPEISPPPVPLPVREGGLA